MTVILAVSGSPSPVSRTAGVVRRAADRLLQMGFGVEHLSVRDLPADDLLAARVESPALCTATEAVARADGVIVATPLYKASYTGLLKAFLDVLPQFALADKAVLPLATGGTLAHVLAIDYALRPVLVSLGARHVAQGYFVLDEFLTPDPNGSVRIQAEAEIRLFDVVGAFAQSLPTPVGIPAQL